jgi:hypothetical protein
MRISMLTGCRRYAQTVVAFAKRGSRFGRRQDKRAQAELVQGDQRESPDFKPTYRPGIDHVEIEATIVTDEDDGLQRYPCRLDDRRWNEFQRAHLRVERRLDQCVPNERMSRGNRARGFGRNEKIRAGSGLGAKHLIILGM